MTDISKDLRQQLSSQISLYSVAAVTVLTAPDSQKALLRLADGQHIESVLMDYGEWKTVCVSSQVGCALNCSFCATGKMGFRRQLSAEEIIDQILFWKSSQNKSFPLSSKGDKGGFRIVFMGMGEPFLNWDNLLAALEIIKHQLLIGSRKISISTAGVVSRIRDFTALDTEINLAISLHSLEQSVRATIMPVARQFTLTELLPSLEDYVTRTRRQLFLEYALIKDVNDRDRDLELLINLLRHHRLYYLNLIPLNPIQGGLIPSLRLSFFQKNLSAAGVNFSLRHSLGQAINSACGQLIAQ